MQGALQSPTRRRRHARFAAMDSVRTARYCAVDGPHAGSRCAAHRMTPFADGVWLDTDPIRIVGMPLTATMTVLRLRDGSVLVHSPLAMTDARRAAVAALGPVAHLYAPNLFHHLSLGDWAAAFSSARVHAPAGLATKRHDLRCDRTHRTTPEPAFADVIDELAIDGFRMQETVLFHRPSRTLVVADLVHNVGRPRHPWAQAYTRAMGFYDRIALSRMLRWFAVSDRAAMRRSVDALLALPLERIVVGHGTPITAHARDALAGAYAWLGR
jgi:hypothetical protein